MIDKRDVLFLEKAFLRPPPAPLRGVELFNLRLIEEMLEAKRSITLVAHHDWRRLLGGHAEAGLECRYSRARGLWGTFQWWRMVRDLRHRAVFLANVGNGLIPLLHLLRWSGAADRLVLLAHRTATPRFIRALRRWPSCVVTVNEAIAEPFRVAGYPRVAVDYGIMNANAYFPAAPRAPDRVRFVVLGALENAWKGADTAVEAFRLLPPDVRARCELHLASYLNPPAIGVEGVTAHPWKPAESIPSFLREMDVMICPSRDEHVMRETFSQAIVQGMLTGLPILANDLPIFREKLDAGGGLLFTSAADLSENMIKLANDPALRAAMGEHGRSTALARYGWDTRRFLSRYFEAPPGE